MVADIRLEILPDSIVGLDVGDVLGVPGSWSVADSGGIRKDGLLLVLLEHSVSKQLHTTQDLGNVVGRLPLKNNPLQATHTLGDHVKVVLEGRGAVRVLDLGNCAHLLLQVLDELGKGRRCHVGLLGLCCNDEVLSLGSECARDGVCLVRVRRRLEGGFMSAELYLALNVLVQA